MYTQTRKAGVREFFLVLAVAVVVYFLYELLRYTIPHMPLVRDLALVICGSVLVYLIYKHYGAVFSYTLEDGVLTLEQKNGHRTRTVSVSCSEMEALVTGKRPVVEKVQSMCVGILPGKKTWYVVYHHGQKAVSFEPDAVLLGKLKEYK